MFSKKLWVALLANEAIQHTLKTCINVCSFRFICKINNHNHWNKKRFIWGAIKDIEGVSAFVKVFQISKSILFMLIFMEWQKNLLENLNFAQDVTLWLNKFHNNLQKDGRQLYVWKKVGSYRILLKNSFTKSKSRFSSVSCISF